MYKDIVIIGAGVAGMTSAIYLKRANADFVLLESHRPGGQINFASTIENYPGFFKVSGRELANKIYEQVKELNVDYLEREVVKISKTDVGFEVELSDCNVIECKKIIIATGKKIKKLDIPNVNEFVGCGLSYCATCDGMFFKNKNVIVVGDTNKALEESLYLSKICDNVTILCDKDKMTADKFFVEQIENVDNVDVMYNTRLVKLIKADNVTGAILSTDNVKKKISIDGCFAYVGYVPNSELVEQIVELNGDKYIKVDKYKETTCKGMYAIGDVTDTLVYQLASCIGDASICSNAILKDN